MPNKNFIHSVGFIVVMYYLFFTYIPQFFFHQLFYEKYLQTYNGVEYSPWSVLFFLLFFIIGLVVLNNVLPKVRFYLNIKKFVNYITILNCFIIVFFFFSSFYFMSKYGVDFRHQHRLNETGIIIKLLWFLKMYVYFYAFFIFTKILNKENIRKLSKINLFLILIGWFITVTSSLQLPLVFILFIMLFLSKNYQNKLLFRRHQKNFISIKSITFSIIIILIVFSMLFLGYSNKIGFAKTVDLFTDSSKIGNVISHIITRVSSSYMSLLLLMNEHFYDFNLQMGSYSGHFETFLSRLSSFLPIFDYHLNDIGTVSRTNFLLTNVDNYLPISGSSPGLLATVFYIPFFPINLLFVLLYTLLIIRTINVYIVISSSSLSIFAKLIILYFVFVLFESPLSLLIIIEPITIFFSLFLFVSYFNSRRLNTTLDKI